MTDYVPVPCGQYADLELAILRRRELRLVWSENGVARCEVLRPIDLRTARGEEFLVCRTRAAGILSIRLDRIRRAEPA